MAIGGNGEIMVSAKTNKKKRGKERNASNAPSTTSNNINGGAPTVGVVGGAPRSRREAVPNNQVQEMIASMQARPSDVLTPSPFSSMTVPHLSTRSLNISTTKIVAKVKKGNKYVTESLAKSSIEGLSLVHSGVLSIVLDFLKKCENDTFDEVMADVGGNLHSPSSWINILLQAFYEDQSCRLKRCAVNCPRFFEEMRE